MASTKIVTVIILSWNTKTLLKQCLDSIVSSLGSDIVNLEIIVVDNGSADGSPTMVKHDFPQAKLIENKSNLGFGAANNQAMKIARGRYWLLLNSDTQIKGRAPLIMAEYMDKHPEIGALGCRLLNPDGSRQASAGPFPDLLVSGIMLFFEHWAGNLVRSSYEKVREVDWVMGAAYMVRPSTVVKAGRMDESIFMYMDEVEWSLRIKKAGYKIVFYPAAEIIHLGAGSSRTGRQDPVINIYRGLIYMYKKHYSRLALYILRLMLKLKALGALVIGCLKNDRYLKETYAKAYKMAGS